MVKLYVKARAELSNVTNLEPLDTAESPFEYTFTIQCTSCRTTHDKPVNINSFEQHDITGSKGLASFVFRCRECKAEHSTLLTRTKQKLTLEDNGKWVKLVELDSRGMDFLEFIPEGRFQCVGAESGTKFDEVDLEELEWYDYDDSKNQEVSVTEAQFEIARS